MGIYSLLFLMLILPPASALVCCIFLLARSLSHPELKWLIGYTGFYFIVSVLTFFMDRIFPVETSNIINQNLAYLLVLSELLFYYGFFRRVLRPEKMKIMTWIVIAYSVFFLVMLILNNLQGIMAHSQITLLYVSQALVLLTACAFYFINVFTRYIDVNLQKTGSFWVVFGLLFLKAGILPFVAMQVYIATNYLQYELVLMAMYAVFATLNFLVILKASLCKFRVTSSSLSF